MDREIHISQCMIVKNEERNIERALSWGRGIMWEQIVVDTGSTDRTVELAEKLGAKVYHFPWIDDFAAAKNFACEKAKGDWIAFLDADEYMEKADAENLYALLADFEENAAPYLAVFTNLYNLNDSGGVFGGGSQLRFFRNFLGIHYSGRVHERLVKGHRELKESELLDACEELSIYHTGYTKQALAAAHKTERYEKMLFMEVEEHPGDPDAIGNLADVYQAMGNYDLAIEWYYKAVERYKAMGCQPQERDQRMSWTFSRLLELLMFTGTEEKMILQVYGQAVWYLPKECDFDYLAGNYFLSKRNWKQAADHFERALRLLEEHGKLFYGMKLTANLMRAQESLAVSYCNLGQRESCVKACVEFLRQNRFAMGILKVLLTAFKTGGEDAGQVLRFLEKLYESASLKDRLFLLKAAKEMEYKELIEELRILFSPQELEALAGRI